MQLTTAWFLDPPGQQAATWGLVEQGQLHPPFDSESNLAQTLSMVWRSLGRSMNLLAWSLDSTLKDVAKMTKRAIKSSCFMRVFIKYKKNYYDWIRSDLYI